MCFCSVEIHEQLTSVWSVLVGFVGVYRSLLSFFDSSQVSRKTFFRQWTIESSKDVHFRVSFSENTGEMSGRVVGAVDALVIWERFYYASAPLEVLCCIRFVSMF